MKNSGHDAYGKPCEIGDTDSDGEIVGYIDESGLCWTSEGEAQIARAVGAHCDAFNAFNRSGGLLGVAPDAEAIVARYCDDESDAREALGLIEVQEDHRPLIAPPVMAAIAASN